MNYIETLKIKDGNDARLSYSSLKEFNKSPLDFLKYINRDFVETDAMIIGSATDCLLLEPEKFDERYLIIPNIKRTTKAGKEEYANYLAEATQNNKKILKEADHEKISMMCESVKSNPQANYLLMNTHEVQKTIEFEVNKKNEIMDNVGPLSIRGIADGVGESMSKPFIFDLKTTNDFGSINSWSWNIVKWSYHLQASIYHYAILKEKIKSPDFYHIVVENKEPYKVYVLKFSDEMIKTGRKLFNNIIKNFLTCKIDNSWHMGSEFYSPSIQEIDLPNNYKID